MKHEEFLIGEEFWCGANQWRCTDIGTRVIVAISLGSHEIVLAKGNDKIPDLLDMLHEATDDPSWFNGPPYAVSEHVFDEDSIVGCFREP